MTLSTELFSVIATVNIAVVGYLAKQISNLGRKLDQMVCDPLCRERSDKCQKALCGKIRQLEGEDKSLWKRLNTHRHTNDGDVVIGHE